MTYVLWTLQALLAILFLMLGGMKVTTPLDQLSQLMGAPGALILFIGVSEVLGAVGLILPGLLKIRAGLTPLAAAGLAVIAVGATIFHVVIGDGLMALFPLVVAALAAFVAYSRWQLAPRGARMDRRTLQPAG